MRVTLAVPNLNGQRFLAETLASLSRSNEVAWWLQDGKSLDESVNVAKSFLTSGCSVCSGVDQGQADALNRAIDRMGGDIVGYINADDLLAPGAAKAVLDTFEANPDVDIVYGEVEWIDSFGVVTGHHVGDISCLEEILDIYTVWWAQRQWVQPEVFFRRRVWENVGHFNTGYDLAFDFEYWVRCFEAGMRVKRIPKVLARFRIHANQKSRNATAAADEIRDIVRAALDRDPPIPSAVKRRIRNQLSYDRYQSGQDTRAGRSRPSFVGALARNPGWLKLPGVRRRIAGSITDSIARNSETGGQHDST